MEAVAAKMGSTDPKAMKAVAGKLSDAESIVALKDLFNRMGAGNTVAEGVEGVSADARTSYLFNSNIVGVEDADLVLLVGSDPRAEAPVLNARLRRANVAGKGGRVRGERRRATGSPRNLIYFFFIEMIIGQLGVSVYKRGTFTGDGDPVLLVNASSTRLFCLFSKR